MRLFTRLAHAADWLPLKLHSGADGKVSLVGRGLGLMQVSMCVQSMAVGATLILAMALARQ